MNEPLTLLGGTEEAALVEMARGGNKEAFGELMVRWEAFIKTSLRKVLDHPEDVEDALQHTVLALMVGIQSIKHDNFQGWVRWVIKCQRHHFLKRVIYKSNRLKTEQEVVGYGYGIHCAAGREEDPALICECMEIQHDVRKAIDCLPVKQQEAIREIFLKEETYQKAAEEKGVTQSAITGRLKRGKEFLRNSLPQYKYPLL